MAESRTLMPGEVMVLDRRPHLLYFSAQLLGAAALIAALMVMNAASGVIRDGLGWTIAIAATVWALWSAARLLGWYMTHFHVTSRRVIWRTGVLARSGVEIPLDRINNVNFHQTIVERLIGAGDLVIESAGRDGQSRFANIKHPDDVQLVIHKAAEQLRSTAHAPSAAPPAHHPTPIDPATLAASLERLAQMHARGALSDDEFARAKHRLIG